MILIVILQNNCLFTNIFIAFLQKNCKFTNDFDGKITNHCNFTIKLLTKFTKFNKDFCFRKPQLTVLFIVAMRFELLL